MYTVYMYTANQGNEAKAICHLLPEPEKFIDNMIEPHKNVETYPMASMYGTITYIYHKNHLNVG